MKKQHFFKSIVAMVVGALVCTAAQAQLTVTSPAFAGGGVIPDPFTYNLGTRCTGKNWSPPLTIAGIPEDTQTLAIRMVDTSASAPVGGPADSSGKFLQWKVWDIAVPAGVGRFSLPYNAAASLPAPADTQALNSFGKRGYGGPCPPSGATHSYTFTVYALTTAPGNGQPSDKDLNDLPNARKGTLTGTRTSSDHVNWDPFSKPPAPTKQYTGQWIKTDEDAWGVTVLMNFPGNSSYIFAPWYAYDNSGKASWYLFEGDTWLTSDTITVDVYRYMGPNWGAASYDNNSVTKTKAGTATLTFTSATTATLEYDVEGASRTISLDKLDGDSGTLGQYTGQWYKPDENAWGLSVLQNFHNPNYFFVPWFTYDSSGRAFWYIFESDKGSGNTISADVYRYAGPPWGTMPYDNSKVAKTKAGTATLTFTSATAATFQYSVDGASRTINLVKLE